MNFKDILKKFWFVILVGVFFISIAIYFAWDRNKDLISAKSVDGKDVIFSLNKKHYTADEYYEELFSKSAGDGSATTGVQLAFALIERSVVRQSVEATDKMKKQANETYETVKASLKEEYGKNFDSFLTAELRKYGYESASDLEDMYLDQLLAKQFYIDYIKQHPELFDEVYEKDSPRVLAQILVKVQDIENPTDTEKARMAEIDTALKDKDFGEVAKKYSDDTSSASNNGNLGIQIKSSTLADEVKAVAWALNDGAVSDWVKTKAGYHRIKVITSDKEKMRSDETLTDSLVNVVLEHFPNLSKEVVWKRAVELKVEIKDETLKADILKYVGAEK